MRDKSPKNQKGDAVHQLWTVCMERAVGCMGQNAILNMFLFLKYFFGFFKPSLVKIWELFWKKYFILPRVPPLVFQRFVPHWSTFYNKVLAKSSIYIYASPKNILEIKTCLKLYFGPCNLVHDPCTLYLVGGQHARSVHRVARAKIHFWTSFYF